MAFDLASRRSATELLPHGGTPGNRTRLMWVAATHLGRSVNAPWLAVQDSNLPIRVNSPARSPGASTANEHRHGVSDPAFRSEKPASSPADPGGMAQPHGDSNSVCRGENPVSYPWRMGP